MYKLLSTSKRVSTLLGHGGDRHKTGEGSRLLEYFKAVDRSRLWDQNYHINYDLAFKYFNKYWDTQKLILCEKSPENICRVQQLDQYLLENNMNAKYIIMIRNPYTIRYNADEWITYAQYQKDNIEKLDKTRYIIITYEQMVY